MNDPSHADPSTDRVTGGPLLDLRDELVAAAARQSSASNDTPKADGHERPVTYLASPRRPVRSWIAAAALVLLIASVAIAASFAAKGGDVAADVNVQRSGDSVTVSVDDDVTPSQIRDALDRAGVEVEVTGQTTGPSLVNRFVGIVGPPTAELRGGDGTSAPAATFEAGSDVELLLGVAADPGEDYDVPTDATAIGEPFAGLDVVGRSVADARADIDRASGGRIEVDYRDTDGRATDDPDVVGIIESTMSLSTTRVVVIVASPPRR